MTDDYDDARPMNPGLLDAENKELRAQLAAAHNRNGQLKRDVLTALTTERDMRAQLAAMTKRAEKAEALLACNTCTEPVRE